MPFRSKSWLLALAALFGSHGALADVIQVTSYATTNGDGTANYGSFNYYDSTYNGPVNNNTVEGTTFNSSGLAVANTNAVLSGGKGILTDGVIATQNYSVVPTQYVGWKYIDPTITFNLAANSGVHQISVAVGLSPAVPSYLDATGQLILGSGLVGPPSKFQLSVNGGSSTTYVPVASSVTGNSEILSIIFANNIVGDIFTLTLLGGPLLQDGIDYQNFYNSNPADIRDTQFNLNAGLPDREPWQMVSEVSFLSAVPEPSTWMMMIAGFVGLSFVGYRRKSKMSALAMS